MKVKYRIPVISYIEGEIELSKDDENYFKRNYLEMVAEGIAYTLHEEPVLPMDGAFEFGSAYIEEIKEKVTLDDVREVD